MWADFISWARLDDSPRCARAGAMSALFDFKSFLTVVFLTICTCTYVKLMRPNLLSHRTGWVAVGPCMHLLSTPLLTSCNRGGHATLLLRCALQVQGPLLEGSKNRCVGRNACP